MAGILMINSASLPVEFKHLEGLINSALERWSPGATLRIIRALGGFSGAAVLKIDISGGAIPAGQYILKLYEVPQWEGEASEEERHKLACARHPAFAREHIPDLRQHFRETGQAGTEPERSALLYEIAGSSLESFRTIDAPDTVSGTVERTSEALFRDLLEKWADESPSDPVTPRSILQEWLGYRLDPKKGKALYDFVQTEFGTARDWGQTVDSPQEGLALGRRWHVRGCCLRARSDGHAVNGFVRMSCFPQGAYSPL